MALQVALQSHEVRHDSHTLAMGEIKTKWSSEINECLNSEIEVRPCLYDTMCKEYSNRDSRRVACEDII